MSFSFPRWLQALPSRALCGYCDGSASYAAFPVSCEIDDHLKICLPVGAVLSLIAHRKLSQRCKHSKARNVEFGLLAHRRSGLPVRLRCGVGFVVATDQARYLSREIGLINSGSACARYVGLLN